MLLRAAAMHAPGQHQTRLQTELTVQAHLRDWPQHLAGLACGYQEQGQACGVRLDLADIHCLRGADHAAPCSGAHSAFAVCFCAFGALRMQKTALLVRCACCDTIVIQHAVKVLSKCCRLQS